MIRLSIHLPPRYRLDIKIVKPKILDETPLLPSLGKIMRAKKGDRFSRYFRHVFEHAKIKKLFGTNLAIFAFASSFTQAQIGPIKNPVSFNGLNTNIIVSTETSLQYPIKEIKITQGFKLFHQGIDLDGVTGDAIYPIMSGRVKKTEYSRFGYGKSVIISHGDGAESLYAHLSKIEVTEGQEVTKNTKIGEMGATGRSFGDHLHLEVYENGKPINPLSILEK